MRRMLLDCAIIGGGPAGLSAALVLGRARRTVMLFDDNKPRNAVTRMSHGFITRDGISPTEFRALAHKDIQRYPHVSFSLSRIIDVRMEPNGFTLAGTHGVDGDGFRLTNTLGQVFRARTIILATGVKERLPAIAGLAECYGKSLFSCPYCDGWELRDKPLVIVSESPAADHLATLVRQWSSNLILCTNGKRSMNEEQIRDLQMRGIRLIGAPIRSLVHQNGQLMRILFHDGGSIERSGGFISAQWEAAASFSEALGCIANSSGGIATDHYGRTSVKGVYAAGDNGMAGPSQLIIAAGEGSKAAIGVNTDLTFGF